MRTECWVPLLDHEVAMIRHALPSVEPVLRDGVWMLHVHSNTGQSVEQMVRQVQHILAEAQAGHALPEPKLQ